MRILPLIAIAMLFAFFFSITASITSCTKTRTVYDTTIINVHDTAILNVHDTTIVKDSIYDLKNGLVAYFSFNNGSLTDSSVYNNNIIFNNASKTADRFGNPNNAYLFDGTSSYMQVKNTASLNPDNITLYAIIKVNGFYTGQCSGNAILGKGSSWQVNGFYNMAFTDFSANCGTPNLNNETFEASYGDNIPQGVNAGCFSVNTIKTGQWYHITYTYDGLIGKMYMDGNLVSTNQKMVNFTDNSNDVYIGKTQDPTYPYYFNGVIDEIRIYNRALSAGAIKELNNLSN